MEEERERERERERVCVCLTERFCVGNAGKVFYQVSSDRSRQHRAPVIQED